MALYADRGFYKRAQIAASDLDRVGAARFKDLDKLTIFADNLVPHVLRCEGCCCFDDGLAELIDAVDRCASAARNVRSAAAPSTRASCCGPPRRRIPHWTTGCGTAASDPSSRPAPATAAGPCSIDPVRARRRPNRLSRRPGSGRAPA